MPFESYHVELRGAQAVQQFAVLICQSE